MQEYKVTTSQEPRREERDRIEEEEEEEEEEEDDEEEEETALGGGGAGGDYRSLLMNSYQLQQQREQRKEVKTLKCLDSNFPTMALFKELRRQTTEQIIFRFSVMAASLFGQLVGNLTDRKPVLGIDFWIFLAR